MQESDVRRVLAQSEEKLERYQARGHRFQVGSAAEAIARCHRLLGDESSARRYFTMAAWAARQALDDRLAEGEEVEPFIQWLYLFKSLWMYFQAGNPQKVEEVSKLLIGLIDEWPPPVPLLQREQGTLACYVAGDVHQARALYDRLELNRWEKTPHHPEVKLLRAGLFDDGDAARRAVEIAERRIVDEEIEPWFPNHIEYDLVSMAQALIDQSG